MTVFLPTQVLLEISNDGAQWLEPGPLENGFSLVAPSLATFNGRLWMAFIDQNNVLNVASYGPGGPEGVNVFSGVSLVPGASRAAPSLAVFNNKLWMAIIANNTTNTLLLASSSDGIAWSGFVGVPTPGNPGRSLTAPSLASFNNKLWMAIVADNNTGTLLLASSPDGANWSAFAGVPGLSKAAPSLAAFDNKLWMAIIADNKTNTLLLASSSDGTTWSSFVGVPTPGNPGEGLIGPSLAAGNDRLWMAAVANNPTATLLLASSQDGMTWSNFFGALGAASSTGVSVGFDNLGQVCLAYAIPPSVTFQGGG